MKPISRLFLPLLVVAIFQSCIPTGGGVANPNAFAVNKTVNQLSYPAHGVEKVISLPFINDSFIVSQYDWPLYASPNLNVTTMQIQAPTDIEMVTDSLSPNGNQKPRSLSFNSTLDATISNWTNPYYNIYLIDQLVEYNRVFNVPTGNTIYTALIPDGIHYFGFRTTKTNPYTYFWLKTEIKNNPTGGKQLVINNGAYGSGSVIVGK
ncbi:MAG: hypothetical protein JWN78_1334 [Bacteroidota bacterium]|nr:hypothetical protein [Bacteroidota bacterium]